MFKKIKKAQGVLLLVLTLLTASTGCTGARDQLFQAMPQSDKTFSGRSYTDIRSSWAYEAISFALEKGIFNGTSETTFSPDEPITEGAFAASLDKVTGNRSRMQTAPENSSKTLTRRRMAVLLYQTIRAMGVTPGIETPPAFTDKAELGSDTSAIDAVTALGLMSGISDGSFAPEKSTTRAEAAVVIFRLVQLIDEANTNSTMLAAISDKTAAIPQYTDYLAGPYKTIALKNTSITFTGSGVLVDGSNIIVNQPGTYMIRGTLTDGKIIVDNKGGGQVRLVLCNAHISSSGTPITVRNSQSTVLSLPPGTESNLTNNSMSDDVENTAGLYSGQGPLWINGSGTLTVNAKNGGGISGKGDIGITQARLVIAAASDGINAEDSIDVNNADIEIRSGGDGLRTTGSSEIGKGCIMIKDGLMNITSGSKGMHAKTLLYIQSGHFNVSTTGNISGGRASYSKGLTAGCGIVIDSGGFHIDSVDDAFHSDGLIRVNGGDYYVLTGDDGLHADTSLSISGGTVKIVKCYEGLEGKNIDLSGGEIDITSSNDGINIAGGSDSFTGNRSVRRNSGRTYKLTIRGGKIKINATGDGIDVNGSAYMTGGNVLVFGPTGDGNSAIDYDGVFEISGGTLLASGSSAMAMTPSAGSTQCTIADTLGARSSGTAIKLTDVTGSTIAAFTPVKSYQHVIISTPDIVTGGAYKLYAGDSEVADFIVSSAVSNNER